MLQTAAAAVVASLAAAVTSRLSGEIHATPKSPMTKKQKHCSRIIISNKKALREFKRPPSTMFHFAMLKWHTVLKSSSFLKSLTDI